MRAMKSWFECYFVAIFDTPEGLKKMDSQFSRRILDGERGARLRGEIKKSPLSEDTKANLYLNMRKSR